MTYSKDIRALVRLDAIQGKSVEFTSMRLNIHKRTVIRMRKCWEDYGTLFNPLTCRSGAPRTIDSAHQRVLQALVQSRADWYLQELQEEMAFALGKPVPLTTVWRALDREGITHMQLAVRAQERNEQDRAAFLARMAQYPREYFVFTDEAANDDKTLERRYGWAPRGGRPRATHCAFYSRNSLHD
ncbi:hypothetical protein CcCBS67573_g10350 [Chytriomyces confervae]|uniref:Winged helix-turn helix domain-containing protein n=1 Tax=Chytriomyces confervae TaxID=246404 RepID=A0A507D2N4_9FUNG|nr:hypothetical protein CcCBS67573_g10350 [Chytriomyces confervae]